MLKKWLKRNGNTKYIWLSFSARKNIRKREERFWTEGWKAVVSFPKRVFEINWFSKEDINNKCYAN